LNLYFIYHDSTDDSFITLGLYRVFFESWYTGEETKE